MMRLSAFILILSLGACARTDEPFPLSLVSQAVLEDSAPLAAALTPDFQFGEGVADTALGYIQSYETLRQSSPDIKILNQAQSQLKPGVIEVKLQMLSNGEQIDLNQQFTLRDGKIAAARIETTLADEAPLLTRAPDKTAYAPVVQSVSFPPGSFPEGLAVADDGTGYVSMLFSQHIWKVTQDGQAAIWATLPIRAGPPPLAQGLFCLAPGPAGSLYASVAGRPGVVGLWQVVRDGRAEKVADLPPGTTPNGLTVLDDGRVLIADTFGGRIWAVDPENGGVSVWLDDTRLNGRPFKADYPGINGIQSAGDTVVVTVSDTGMIYRIPVLPGGKAGPIETVTDALAGDDFAIAPNGSLFVTTHPFNSVIKLDDARRQTLMADPSTGMVGPTAAVLFQDNLLYVVTDGGLFLPVEGIPIIPRLLILDVGDTP